MVKAFLRFVWWAAVLMMAAYFFLQGDIFAQDVTINCERGKPVAEIQADGKIKVRCVVENSPPVGEIPTTPPTQPPTSPPPPPATNARDWFAKADGSGDCSVSKPCALAFALGKSSPVRAGDTLWLRGGTYQGNVISMLTGSEGKPVTVRQYPGERATIDGNLRIEGAWAIYRDFEVTISDPDRTKVRPSGIDMFAPNSKLINLVIHDTGNGIGFWSPAINSEVYGCILYRNGWEGPTDNRGHGHGIYAQNAEGRKVIADNISFENYSTAMKAFAEKGDVRNITFEGNVGFNSGSSAIPREAYDRIQNFIVGAAINRAGGIVVKDNVFWHPKDAKGQVAFFGYSSDGNDDISVTGNYFLGNGVLALAFNRWQAVEWTENYVRGSRELLSFQLPAKAIFGQYLLNNNTYLILDDRFAFTAHTDAGFSGFSTLAKWQAVTGQEKASGVLPDPKGPTVIVRPNKYQPGRAHIVVINWSGAASVDVDLAGVKQSGQVFEIVNARDYYGRPVAEGKYAGKVTLPLTGEIGVWVVR